VEVVRVWRACPWHSFRQRTHDLGERLRGDDMFQRIPEVIYTCAGICVVTFGYRRGMVNRI
jgi:hypothetical protein